MNRQGTILVSKILSFTCLYGIPTFGCVRKFSQIVRHKPKTHRLGIRLEMRTGDRRTIPNLRLEK
jgi:hypothetical protein